MGLSYAMTLETNAIKLSKAGNEEGATKEIKNALHLLNQVLPSAKTLTPPDEFSHYAPANSWLHLTSNMKLLITMDESALRSTSPGGFRSELYNANHVKEQLYTLVDDEVRFPKCSELINLRGPITVNGVAQGSSQLSVDVSCNRPEQKVIVVVPANTVVKAAPDGQAKAVILRAGHIVEVDLNGATSGGVTMQTSPDAAAPDPVDSDVIPIKGDSHPSEYFDEVM